MFWQRNGTLFSNITFVGMCFLSSKQLNLQMHFWNMTHLHICWGLSVPGIKKFPMNSSVAPTASASYTDLTQGISYNVPKFEGCPAFFQKVLATGLTTPLG